MAVETPYGCGYHPTETYEFPPDVSPSKIYRLSSGERSGRSAPRCDDISLRHVMSCRRPCVLDSPGTGRDDRSSPGARHSAPEILVRTDSPERSDVHLAYGRHNPLSASRSSPLHTHDC